MQITIEYSIDGGLDAQLRYWAKTTIDDETHYCCGGSFLMARRRLIEKVKYLLSTRAGDLSIPPAETIEV